MAKRRYTTSEKQQALETLAETGGNLRKAAEQTGIPRKSLEYIARSVGLRGGSGLSGGGTYGEQRFAGTSEDQAVLTAKWAKAARVNADELSNAEKVRGATLGQNAVAAGIAQDKLNLLTGRATSRTEIVRARYVEPDALRRLSIRVIEVAPHPAVTRIATSCRETV